MHYICCSTPRKDITSLYPFKLLLCIDLFDDSAECADRFSFIVQITDWDNNQPKDKLEDQYFKVLEDDINLVRR